MKACASSGTPVIDLSFSNRYSSFSMLYIIFLKWRLSMMYYFPWEFVPQAVSRHEISRPSVYEDFILFMQTSKKIVSLKVTSTYKSNC